MVRMPAGDADENGVFTVRFVPEVFAKFDDLSFELSKMGLTGFRQNVMAQEMRGESCYWHGFTGTESFVRFQEQ